MNEFPSLPEQAKNMTLMIADVIKNAVTNNQIFIQKNESNRRYDICQACEHFEPTSKRCKQCGCYMEAKVTYTAAQCPIQKW